MSIEDRCIAPVPFRDKPHSHFFKKVGMRGNDVLALVHKKSAIIFHSQMMCASSCSTVEVVAL